MLMAWVTPVTNRTYRGGSRMTYVDMNRITGNISYLYNYANSHGHTVSSVDVSQIEWTQNDIISRQFWRSMWFVFNRIHLAYGLPEASYQEPTGYAWVNYVELRTLYLWQHIVEPSEYELLQSENAVQLQTEDGVDIEVGLLPIA